MSTRTIQTIVAAVIIVSCAAFVRADYRTPQIVSTFQTETLGGVEVRDGDLAQYDFEAQAASLVFNENVFTDDEDIDAVHMLADGHFLLSTRSAGQIGGLTFTGGDLVEYDPIVGTASTYLSQSVFTSGGDVDAVYVRDNGNIVMSTNFESVLAGLTFQEGDVIEYDPIAETAWILVSKDIFVATENIDAFHIMAGGNYLISTAGNATLDSGLAFRDGDVIEYNPVTGAGSIYFSEDMLNYSEDRDIDAVTGPIPEPPTPDEPAAVPEPATMGLLAMGGIAMLHRRKT